MPLRTVRRAVCQRQLSFLLRHGADIFLATMSLKRMTRNQKLDRRYRGMPDSQVKKDPLCKWTVSGRPTLETAAVILTTREQRAWICISLFTLAILP